MQGLASSKESSRHGFFICLTEVLRLYEECRTKTGSVVEEILQMVDECHNIGNTSKGEEGEYLVGKCFCLGAMIQSGLLDSNIEEVPKIMELLVKLGSKRSYLRIIAYKYIVAYIHSVRKQYKSFITYGVLRLVNSCCIFYFAKSFTYPNIFFINRESPSTFFKPLFGQLLQQHVNGVKKMEGT